VQPSILFRSQTLTCRFATCEIGFINLDTKIILRDKKVMQVLMKMKKLNIAELQNAYDN
jgi:hypothetical protein